MPETITVGTRIRFTKTIDQPAGDELPYQIFARPGQTGIVTEVKEHKGGFKYSTHTDLDDYTFGVNADEIEVLPRVQT